MLTLGDARLGDVDGHLAAVLGVHQLGEAAAVVTVHLQRVLEPVCGQVGQVQGVELLGKDKPFYLGYCPIESNNSMLICIVKKSVVDNVMRNYQKTVLFTTILMGSFII